MKPFLTLTLLFLLSTFSFSLELPKENSFSIKQIEDKNILYVTHTKDKGHISNSLIKLIQYYLLQDKEDYKVVFPQLSVESRKIKGQYYAIEYKGTPKGNDIVKTTSLKGGLFASYIYKGNYKYIGKSIRKTFQKVLQTGKYVPDNREEIRLLYWNSIDDNHPENLITEIQVRVNKLP
ncbi:GyrI-like domain-containing protein [Arcobacter sp. YIC-310]|uniref:GyrI-like domain-containing protein n=1 Tax=Arcobacter sp. YIC-310 TaxID=3376632 RepID=UPI003C24CC0A